MLAKSNRPSRAIVLLAASLMVSCLALTACANRSEIHSQEEAASEAKAALAHMGKWVDAKDGISIQYPQNWSTEGRKTRFSILIFQLWHGLVNGRLAVIRPIKDVPLEKLAKLPKTFHVLGQECTSTQVSCDHLKVGGRDAIQLVYTYSLPILNRERKAVQVHVLNKDSDYLLTFDTPQDLFDQFQPVKDEILKSVEFLP